MSERELTYGEAVKEAIAEEMRRDPRVFLIAKTWRGRHPSRPSRARAGVRHAAIIDTPISEPGYAGIGVGAAMTACGPWST